MSPHGEPWQSHVRLFSPTPQLQSRYASASELTLLFGAQHPEYCLPRGPFRWPQKHFTVAWSPAHFQSRALVTLDVSFLPSPCHPTIQTLESSPPSTQLPPHQHPCPGVGSSLSPPTCPKSHSPKYLIFENWLLWLIALICHSFQEEGVILKWLLVYNILTQLL